MNLTKCWIIFRTQISRPDQAGNPQERLFDLCEFIDFLRTNVKAKNLEELQIPLIITATDLDHGRMVHFHRGSIAERVAASCCMPVMFAPVNIDGTNYVDGGLMMNLPVSTLRRVCDKVVAVNVSPIMAQDYKMNIVASLCVRFTSCSVPILSLKEKNVIC